MALLTFFIIWYLSSQIRDYFGDGRQMGREN